MINICNPPVRRGSDELSDLRNTAHSFNILLLRTFST